MVGFRSGGRLKLLFGRSRFDIPQGVGVAVLIVHTPSAIFSSVCQETLFYGTLLCPCAALINGLMQCHHVSRDHEVG